LSLDEAPPVNACNRVERFEIREDLPDASASKTYKTPFCRFWGRPPRGQEFSRISGS
jgi:hypothetical protein